MNQRSKLIAEQAEKLPTDERVDLIEHLLSTLDKTEADIDADWADEAERRIDAYLRGEVASRDAKAVLGKHLKP